MDTLRFALALEGEGMDRKKASIIAHELYALYAHSVLGGVYKPIDYGDFDELSAKASQVREAKKARDDKPPAINEEMRQEREVKEAASLAKESRRVEQAKAYEALREGIRETSAYLEARVQLNRETARLDFVLKNGLPMEREGEFRYHGGTHLRWFPTQRQAIDAAVKYPQEDEKNE
jgi:hypothetical protein